MTYLTKTISLLLFLVSFVFAQTETPEGTVLKTSDAKYQLTFQSSDNKDTKNFELQKVWADSILNLTNGEVAIELLPVNDIVRHNETLAAVELAVIDGHITALAYFGDRDAAYKLLGDMVGAWSDPRDLLEFINSPKGKDLMKLIHEKDNAVFLAGMTTGLEAFVSKRPINGVADLKGVKMRAPEGMVTDVFKAAGAVPIALSGSEVKTSLQNGVIDASDFSVFSTNHNTGLHDIAPNPIYPGFHSMPLLEVAIGKHAWAKISPENQKAIQQSAVNLAETMLSSLEAADKVALNEAKANPKITVHTWSEAELKKFRNIAKVQWDKFAKQSAKAKQVFDVITGYLTEQGKL